MLNNIKIIHHLTIIPMNYCKIIVIVGTRGELIWPQYICQDIKKSHFFWHGTPDRYYKINNFYFLFLLSTSLSKIFSNSFLSTFFIKFINFPAFKDKFSKKKKILKNPCQTTFQFTYQTKTFKSNATSRGNFHKNLTGFHMALIYWQMTKKKKKICLQIRCCSAPVWIL